MHTVKLITGLVEHHQILAYFVIFLGLIFEGEFILLTTGVLTYLGGLDFGFALLFVFCGGISKSLLGYYIGKVIHKKWRDTKFVKYLEHRVTDVMPNFSHKPFWSIFISKFIMGVNHLVIIFSGFKKINYKTYIKAEFISTAIWAPLLLSLGYFFGYTALNVTREVWRFLLVVFILIIGFLILDKLFAFIYRVFEEFYDKQN